MHQIVEYNVFAAESIGLSEYFENTNKQRINNFSFILMIIIYNYYSNKLKKLQNLHEKSRMLFEFIYSQDVNYNHIPYTFI